MDKKDPAKKIIDLMKYAQPQNSRLEESQESSKIEIQGSGNIVLIGGGLTADVSQRLAELEQTLSLLVNRHQISS